MVTAETLIELRVARGWSVREAANIANLSWVTLEKYEEGVQIPATCNLKRIQHYWKLTSEESFELMVAVTKDKELMHGKKT